MSLLFLIGFVMVTCGKIPTEEFDTEYLVIWALFAIADALWVRGK